MEGGVTIRRRRKTRAPVSRLSFTDGKSSMQKSDEFGYEFAENYASLVIKSTQTAQNSVPVK